MEELETKGIAISPHYPHHHHTIPLMDIPVITAGHLFPFQIRRWKEVAMMIAFAVSSMLLIGLFRSELPTQTIPAYRPQPRPFADELFVTEGQMAIINQLDGTPESAHKIAVLELYLQQWLIDHHNGLEIVTNITSNAQLDSIVQNQEGDSLLRPNSYCPAH